MLLEDSSKPKDAESKTGAGKSRQAELFRSRLAPRQEKSHARRRDPGRAQLEGSVGVSGASMAFKGKKASS